MPEESVAPLTTDSMDEKPCSSTSTSDSAMAVVEEAKKLIGMGKRHLVMGDVVSAVSVFQEACGFLAKTFGDTADECGEAFFLCGKSLLELARMENTVLGNALDGVPEDDSEEAEKTDNPKIESADNLDAEARDELRVQVYDAMSEKAENEGKSEAKVEEQGGDVAKSPTKEEPVMSPAEGDCPSENKDIPEDEKSSEVEDGQREEVSKDKGSEGTEEATVEEEAETVEEGGEKDDDDEEEEEEEGQTADKESDEEEEVGNLQLAWEMLEVAKVIYKRKDTKEDQLMAAQAHLKLGEVGAESGNYSQALEDFLECLAIQLKHLPPHSRLLAETHYQLGLTFGYTSQYSKAIQHFNSSIQVIESRLAMLQEALDKAERTEGAAEEEEEMEELRQLLPDIREKVEDAKESQKTAAEASEAIQETLARGPSSSFSAENGETSSSEVSTSDGASSSKLASDISHLVRRKRKPEEESPLKNGDAKKAKQEASVNGSTGTVDKSDMEEKMEQEEVTEQPTGPVETST